MKVVLSTILFSSFACYASASAVKPILMEGDACKVIYDPGNGNNGRYVEVDMFGNGTGFCSGTGQEATECNYHIHDSGNTTGPFLGTCEFTRCEGNNGKKPPGDGSHRVTICHRTCSEVNPWVRITIDKMGWNNETNGDCKHGVHHDIRDECSGKAPWTAWGGVYYTDYLLKDHGIKKDLCITQGWCNEDGTEKAQYAGQTAAWEKAYWDEWEPACPYVRKDSCCDWGSGNCCGEPAVTTTSTESATTTTGATTGATTTTAATTTTTTTGTTPAGGGGDPHFQRWGQEHDSFHGECDLVMIHSEDFHDGKGFDLQARTTIQDYFSYIETMAMRIGENIIEFHRDHFIFNGVHFTAADLPMTFGDDFKYTISNAPVPEGRNPKFYQYYNVDLDSDSSILFRFYKQFVTFQINGHINDFVDAVGLMGDYRTGAMIDRDGKEMSDFEAFGFEWQVNPQDPVIFQTARPPQLPYEKCRMPTASRPARRLRSNAALLKQAEEACASVSGNGYDLCIDDVLTTGDTGLASIW